MWIYRCLKDCGDDAHHHIEYDCQNRPSEFDESSDFFFPKKEQVEVRAQSTTHNPQNSCYNHDNTSPPRGHIMGGAPLFCGVGN